MKELRVKRNKHVGIQILELSDADSEMPGINRFKNLSDKKENFINYYK